MQAQLIARWVLCWGHPLRYTSVLTAHNLKAVYSFGAVSTASLIVSFSEGRNNLFFLSFYLLVNYLFDYDRLFIIDCSSGVSPLQRLRLPNQTFIEVASIAIWNRNKVIMAISISMWGINPVLLVQSKFHLSIPWVIGTKPHNDMHESSGCACEHSIPYILNHDLISSLASRCVGSCPTDLRKS